MRNFFFSIVRFPKKKLLEFQTESIKFKNNSFMCENEILPKKRKFIPNKDIFQVRLEGESFFEKFKDLRKKSKE